MAKLNDYNDVKLQRSNEKLTLFTISNTLLVKIVQIIIQEIE